MKPKICIIVEVINREMDNALLLKEALKMRDYNVKIMFKTFNYSKRKNDLLIIPNAYNDENYYYYRYRFNCPTNNVINMQYEQVLARDDIDGIQKVVGKCLDIKHICWGENAIRRNTKYGVEPKNLFKCGAIQLDSTRSLFYDLYKKRDEIADKYKLDSNKKWILFISSFTYTSDGALINILKSENSSERLDRFKDVSCKSKREILDWFETFLEKNHDYVIIYRPHPVEVANNELYELAQKYNNFYVISDYGIKQWIYVSDIITTWFSTAAVESIYFEKNVLILRPYEIDSRDECIIYEGSKSIDNYEDFEKSIIQFDLTNKNYPFDMNLINDYYFYSDKPAFLNICDVVDKCFEENYYKEKKFKKSRFIFLMKNKIIFFSFIKRIYMFMHKNFKLKIHSKKLRSKFFVDEWEKDAKNVLLTKREQKKKINLYRNIIENYDRKDV